MGLTPLEREGLGSYRVKGVIQVSFNQCKEERASDVGPSDSERFKGTFLNEFFLLEMRASKVQEFIKLRQGSMIMKQHAM